MVRRWIGVIGWLVVCVAPSAFAQVDAASTYRGAVFVGSEADNYLRYLQSLTLASAMPWSLRPLSPTQLSRLAPADSGHPFAADPVLKSDRTKHWGAAFEVLPATAQTWYNSAFPFGINDGAVWLGRGVTAAVDGGVAMRAGPFSAVIAPTAFVATNQRFTLLANGYGGDTALNDGVRPEGLDHPQRFGSGVYKQFDAGQSTVRVDAFGFTAGVSSANEAWGPMSDFPYILGNNAAGMPHLFAGSSRPWSTWAGRVHGRLMYARANPSIVGTSTANASPRFISALVGVYEPRGIPGLELGAIRFIHSAWPDSGLSLKYFTHILESILKKNIGDVFNPVTDEPNESADNQLASVFARWSPGGGFEVYGEFGREDHNWDMRDLIVELDHSATIGLGVRKAWMRSADRMDALQIETANLQENNLGRHRGEGSYYVHGNSPGGHTHLGQLLGSGFVSGGGAATSVRWERFTPRGTTTATFLRMMVADAAPADVQHAFSLGKSMRRSPEFTVNAELTAVYELNRHFAGDAINWQLRTGATWFGRRSTQR